MMTLLFKLVTLDFYPDFNSRVTNSRFLSTLKTVELVTWDYYLDFNSRVSNSRFLSWLNFKGMTLIWKEKINNIERKNIEYKIERKKGRSGSNRKILVHSNVSKFFKKQNTNILYCFVKRRCLDESSNIMDEKTPFILTTMKLPHLRSVVDQILKMNTSWCLLGCFCESFRYLEQYLI